MARPKNIPIDVAQGATKDVTFCVAEGTDLTAADICLVVGFPARTDILLSKGINLSKSPNLEEGVFVISITPEDIANLEPRTYQYTLTITNGEEITIPLIGDFKVYSTTQ